MVNIRYHIVSIAAVFLALAIGLALGSTFVDSVLVSNLESQVNQLEADTQAAEQRQEEAELERDATVAILEAAQGERALVENLVRPYLPQGRLSGTVTLIVAPETVDTEAVGRIRTRLSETDTRLGGVLWLNDGLRLHDAAARERIANAFSLAGNSRNAVQRALSFLLPQALFEPDAAGIAPVDVIDAVDFDLPALFPSDDSDPDDSPGVLTDPVVLSGFPRGFGAVPRTRTALTVLRDLELVTHDGTGGVALHLLGGDELRLVVVTDAASEPLNNEFLFGLLRAMADQGNGGRAVVVEVLPVGASGRDGFESPRVVLDRLALDEVLAAAYATVDGVATFSGDLALLVALESLPEVRHYSSLDEDHGLGGS